MGPAELLVLYRALPAPARQACEAVAEKVLEKLGGELWEKLRSKDALGSAFARVYDQWRRGLLRSDVSDKKAAEAFAQFFCRPRTIQELEKLRQDRYPDIDFDLLAQELRESCEFYGCPLPDNDAWEQLEGWIEGLQALLRDLPEYQQRFQPSLQNALRSLKEPGTRNVSLARRAYRKECVQQHRLIRFRGMAEVGGPPEVEMAKVFVMPRVAAREDYRGAAGEERKPVSAQELLKDPQAPRRLVVLGKPGSGKTTLLEYLALSLARREDADFAWASELPDLLPVFYRVRHLDRDLRDNPGAGIWECLHVHCLRRLGLDLPVGFFRRQMSVGGLLLLLDGLDEVPSEGRRIELVDDIAAFNRKLPAGSRVILSSRPLEYRRSQFAADEYAHWDLCDFDDGEIQEFLQGWYRIHEANRAAAGEQAGRLWKALESNRGVRQLAGNALLLTMIVRVHFGLRALPDSRVDLYAKCADTLLKHWLEAAGQEAIPFFDLENKRRFLAQLAFDLQDRAAPEELGQDDCLQISKGELRRRLEQFLTASAGKEFAPQAGALLERLYTRDAILVNYGGDQFGFVHRSFQEYFAAHWLAEQHGDFDEFRKLLLDRWIDRAGWNETLCLAFGQIIIRNQSKILLELLEQGRVEFALQCLSAGAQQDLWLRTLVQFLSRYYRDGEEHAGLKPADCAELCAGRPELLRVLRGLFDRDRRDGRALAAAVELAEELAPRGVTEAQGLLGTFFSDSTAAGLDSTDRMALVTAGPFPYGTDGALLDVPAFYLDRYPVTNRDYECMIPRHRLERDEYSNTDDQPVIYVTWHEVNLYCRWRGAAFRLPTEQEWEKAASWNAERSQKRAYPWGDEFDPAKCNTSEGQRGKTTPVGVLPEGVSSWGCYDMAGNVWEWTSSQYSEEHPYPVLRGGAWLDFQGFAACAYRNYGFRPHCRVNSLGFRCARTSA